MADPRMALLAGNVLAGRDGHLFDGLPPLLAQLAGARNLTPAELARWIALLETRVAWCRLRGIRYYLLITPNKHVVYPDMLPHGVATAEDRPITRLLAGLPPELRDVVIYPAETLRQGRTEAETYFRTDTHWTDDGALVVWQALRAALQRDAVLPPGAMPALARSTYRHVGDLGVRLTPEPVETATRLRPAEAQGARRVFANFTYNVGQVEVFERAGFAGPRAVVFRDSSGSALLPFLAHEARRLVAVAAANIFYDLLRSEAPDVVISQITEHGLCASGPDSPVQWREPDDFPMLDFPGFTGVALPIVVSEAGDGAVIADLDFTDRRAAVWTEGEYTEIVLKARVPFAPCRLVLRAAPFVHPPDVPRQRVEIAVNGRIVGGGAFDGGEAELACAIPADCLYSGRTLRVELFHPDFVVPRAHGLGAETREIGLRLCRLTISTKN